MERICTFKSVLFIPESEFPLCTFPHPSIHASIILLCSHREMQPLWSCDKTLPMKWCTTGGPVLHLGRCCGTPLCGNLLEEVEDAGMRLLHTASINTDAPSWHRLHAQFERWAKKKRKKEKKESSHFCCNMTSMQRAFWKAVRPPTPTSE